MFRKVTNRLKCPISGCQKYGPFSEWHVILQFLIPAINLQGLLTVRNYCLRCFISLVQMVKYSSLHNSSVRFLFVSNRSAIVYKDRYTISHSRPVYEKCKPDLYTTHHQSETGRKSRYLTRLSNICIAQSTTGLQSLTNNSLTHFYDFRSKWSLIWTYSLNDRTYLH